MEVSGNCDSILKMNVITISELFIWPVFSGRKGGAREVGSYCIYKVYNIIQFRSCPFFFSPALKNFEWSHSATPKPCCQKQKE